MDITDDMAIALIEEGIDVGAWSGEVPDSADERIASAAQLVCFAIDARLEDNIRADDDDEGIAEAGRQILSLLALANLYTASDDELRKAAKELSSLVPSRSPDPPPRRPGGILREEVLYYEPDNDDDNDDEEEST